MQCIYIMSAWMRVFGCCHQIYCFEWHPLETKKHAWTMKEEGKDDEDIKESCD